MVQAYTFDEEIKSYKDKQNAAVRLIEIISDLWINHTVELVLFRNQLIDRRISRILNIHQHSASLIQKELDIRETLQVAEVIRQLWLPPSRIDIGKLAVEARSSEQDLRDFVERQLIPAQQYDGFNAKDVVLYGFGRIGRLLARELTGKGGSGKQLRLRAIVTRDEVNAKMLEKRASLLRQDSIHGEFEGLVETDVEKGALIINGTTVYLLSANAPEELDYTRYGIDQALVIDNTGAFRDAQELSRHLQAKGTTQVLLTAPGKGMPNIVYGVNEHDAEPGKTTICSAASCTTNAIAPILAVIEQQIGIVKGHIETVHAYTNDQNLVDNMHKKFRRGRAAALNMVITETGAGSAVAKALPTLDGKLTSNAIRVPVPNGSLAILQLEVKKDCTLGAVKNILKQAALEGNLVEQIKYEDNAELVSSDIVGTTAASVLDVPATIVSADGRNIVLYVWYDNEYGYTHQVIRLARHLAGVRQYSYY